MTNIKLVADTTCDLSAEELQSMNISVVPVSVNFSSRSYSDTIDINSAEMFKIAKETKELPATASPSPALYEEVFAPYVKSNTPIIYISVASVLSSTHNNAVIAKNSFDNANITIIDSQTVSGLIGDMLRTCYKMCQQDCTLEEIIVAVRKLSDNNRLFFTIDGLDYLRRNGRISSTAFVAGSLLGIKPIVEMTKHGLEIRKKARGTAKALESMIAYVKEDRSKIMDSTVHIACIGDDLSQFDRLKAAITQFTGITKFKVYNLGCTLACHSGPGVYGVGYFLNN